MTLTPQSPVGLGTSMLLGCRILSNNYLIRAVVDPILPSGAPVGGVVIPANNLAIAAPWLAVIGLVGCIGTVAVVAKKRRE